MSAKSNLNYVELNGDQTGYVLQHNEAIGGIIVDAVDKAAAPKGEFVFFAAFDGTNNDKDNVDKKSDTPYSTNVGQLWDQYEGRDNTVPHLKGIYCPGLGTQGKPWTGTWAPAAVTRGVVKIAEAAYAKFAEAASEWLKITKNKGPVTVVLTAFSRGAASAAIFSQLLYKKGLVDPSGKVLLKRGKVGVSMGVLFDPVATGVKGNLAFPPNVKNMIVIKALSEFRTLFKAVDYSQQTPMVKTFGMYGNHCDIGGGYDNGLAAVSLEAATKFLQESGLPINDVPYEREREPDQSKYVKGEVKKRMRPDKIRVHKAEIDDYENEIWDVYQTFSFDPTLRLSDSKVLIKPASTTASNRQSFELYDGKRIFV